MFALDGRLGWVCIVMGGAVKASSVNGGRWWRQLIFCDMLCEGGVHDRGAGSVW